MKIVPLFLFHGYYKKYYDKNSQRMYELESGLIVHNISKLELDKNRSRDILINML